MSQRGMSDDQAIAKLAREVEDGYDTFGAAHMLLRAWGREDWPAGPPGRGELLRVRVQLPAPYPGDEIAAIGGADRLGLELAAQEARRIFDPNAATLATTSVSALEQTIRGAVRSCTAVGEHAALFSHFENEDVLAEAGAVPWNGVGTQPAFAYWGTWHRVPVFQTNLIDAGTIWALGDHTARLRVYPDRDGASRIALILERMTTPNHLEARLWIELTARDPRALHRIVLM